jgi:S1-C subfamily serine protease
MTSRAIHSSSITSLCASLLLLSAMALAQNPPGGQPNPTSGRTSAPATHVIRGKIFLPSGGLPDQRIRVVLELNTGGIAGETFSDSVGNFEFRSLSSNSYRVTVPGDHRTFETTQEVVEVYGNFSRTFMVQVYLKDKNPTMTVAPKGKMLSAAEFTQEVPKAAKKSYEQGLKQAKDGKVAEAIIHFQEALKVFPDYLLALNKLGEQYMVSGKLAEAQATFEHAVMVNAKYPLARINLGILMVQFKRYPEAVEHLEAANRVDEGYPMSHLYLGVALMEKEPADLDRAERALLRAREIGGPVLATAHLYLFNLYYRRQAYDKAAAELEAFLKEAPNSPQAPAVRERLEKVKKLITQEASKHNEAKSTAPPPRKEPAANNRSAVSVTDRLTAPTSSPIAMQAFPSVVMLMADVKGGSARQGSGFFIRPDVIVTNYQVVRGATQIQAKMYRDEKLYKAKILNVDPDHNLALLSVFEVTGPPLPLGDFRKVAAGNEVYAVGNPEGLAGTITKGMVSSNSIRKFGTNDVFQIDVPMSPGSSGGPILNARGEVIGLALGALGEGRNLNFAVPAHYLTALLAASAILVEK